MQVTPQNRFYRQLNRDCTALLIILMSVACADLAESDDTNAHKSHEVHGASQYIYYSCETATIAPDGSQWVYQTDEIMNLMDRVELRVIHNDEVYGPSSLLKVATDTFSDGNLTVLLVQKGANKSIEVHHKNTGLFAGAENGWCSFESRAPQGRTVLPTSSADHDYDLFKIEIEPECVNPCSFVMSTNLDVVKVVYEVDGWVIAENRDPVHRFAVSYTFNTLGERAVKAIGYDRYDNLVASDLKSFVVKSSSNAGADVEPEVNRSTRLEVPYFYQYHNRFNPSSSCQNTSIAMVLSALGAQVTPDQITSRFGKDAAQTVSGLNRVYNQLASEYGVSRLHSSSNGSIADVKAKLDQGSPVIIHGYFTSYGHVLVIIGYDESGYYVNDPAGTWSRRFQGGYPNAYSEPTAGRGIFYERSAFEAAIGTYDGYSAAPLWMHSL